MARNFKHKTAANPESNKAISELLSLRGGTNITAKVIAEDAGVAPSTVSKIWNRHTRYPRWETMARIASALGYRYEMVKADDAPAKEKPANKRTARSEHASALH